MTYWHIIRCPGGQEARASIALSRMGYSEVWWPIRKVPLTGFQLQRARAKGADVKKWRKVPWVPGYVFAYAPSVDIYRINSARQIALSVVAPNGIAYTLTDNDMSAMRDYPDRVKAMIHDIAAKEAAERAASRPVVGEAAKITDGPLAGSAGVVMAQRKGEWQISLGAINVWVADGAAERAA